MSPWSDFLPKAALAAANALFLAGAAATAAYLFNRVLERHKRNESIAAELAKQSLSAHLRLLSCVSEINGLLAFWEVMAEDTSTPTEDPSGLYEDEFDAALTAVLQAAPLVSQPFASATLGFVGFAQRHLSEYRSHLDATTASQARLRAQRLALLAAVGRTLPAYVRLPDEEFFRTTSTIEDIYVSVGLWRKDSNGDLHVVGAHTDEAAPSEL